MSPEEWERRKAEARRTLHEKYPVAVDVAYVVLALIGIMLVVSGSLLWLASIK